MKKSSVSIAKDRLRSLLANDRINCLSESYPLIQKELLQVLTKHTDFTEDDFHIEIKRKYIIIYYTGECL